ncbi:MAG: hypothetical protein IT554_07365 [Sphingomonadaceae bacterium]|nr:hypothetical protein [Sphingobium sp.]MBP9157546.1 hypothetical protein [Sphingobium sp.]MCC6482211.1 hypothetical protein [Sphingomonadaceae bacterium]
MRIMPDNQVHISLREATRDWHQRVDDAYSRFDLTSMEGYARFLVAHRLAAAWYQRGLDCFAACVLQEAAPHYGDMLAEDLEAVPLSIPPVIPPLAAWNSPVQNTAFLIGLGYTVCGSRLGMAAIHHDWVQTPFGHRHHPEAHFLADRQGLVLWKKFLGWSKTAALTPQDLQDAAEASADTFALFFAAAQAADALTLIDSQPEICHVS